MAALVIGGLLVVSQPVWTYAVTAPATQNFNRAGLGAALGRLQGGMIATVSKLVGLDQAEIIKERQAGKSMVDIAVSKGVDEKELVNTVVYERKALLDQRVKDGLITEEQAQYCTDNMNQRITDNLNRTNVGPGSGFCGGGGYGMGGGYCGGAGYGAGYGAGKGYNGGGFGRGWQQRLNQQ